MDGGYDVAGSFNQAGFQQFRIHNLYQRIDMLSINPLAMNLEFGVENFKVIFNDLNSVLTYISPKLHEDELKSCKELRSAINLFISEKPIYIIKNTIQNRSSKQVKVVDYTNWNKLWDIIYDYRLEIERLIDKKGIGNPNKSDPRRAIIEH